MPHTPGARSGALDQKGGEDEEKALAAGCVGYIPKPLRLKPFTAAIAAYIEAHTPSSIPTESGLSEPQ